MSINREKYYKKIPALFRHISTSFCTFPGFSVVSSLVYPKLQLRHVNGHPTAVSLLQNFPAFIQRNMTFWMPKEPQGINL